MSPITHLLASWVVASQTTDNPRDRRLVTLSGVLPDLDGAGIVVDYVRQLAWGEEGYWFYQKYHHSLLHGIFGSVVVALLLAVWARARGRVFLMAVVVAHLHFVCDLLGSRGPSALDLWPIHYLAPVSHAWTWTWKHQWALDAWPNRVFTLVLLGWCLAWAVRRGESVVGVFSARADAVFVTVVRGWAARGRARWSPGRGVASPD